MILIFPVIPFPTFKLLLKRNVNNAITPLNAELVKEK